MAVGVPQALPGSAACLPLVSLALLCSCAHARPEQGGPRPPPGEQQPPGQQHPPPGERQPPPGGPSPFDGKPAWMFFVNAGEIALDLHDERGGHLRHLQVLEPGRLTKVDTFIGQSFAIAGQDPNLAKPATVAVRIEGADGQGQSIIPKLWACQYKEKKRDVEEASIECRTQALQYDGAEWDQLVAHMQQSCHGRLQNHPEDLPLFCNHDHTKWKLAQCHYDTSPEEFQWRLEKQWSQHETGVFSDHSFVKRFTKTGHQAAEMPVELFTALRQHWLEKRLKNAQSEVHSRYAVISGCRSEVFALTQLERENPRLADQVVQTLKPLVAQWAGLKAEDLEFTAMCGVRLYRTGSRFSFHRDHPQTHVLSAILEIGLLELDHPDPAYNETLEWPLQIHDHEGNLHTVPHKAGQMIFYESFACPHGRPKLFGGREVANLFVHFRPKDWSPKDYDWKAQSPWASKPEL